MGHTAVTVAQEKAALKLLGAVRFDVIFTGLSGCGDSAARQFIDRLRQLAPGSAVVGINEGGTGAASEPWHAACDATIAEPFSASRVRWVLDFDLRYFGSRVEAEWKPSGSRGSGPQDAGRFSARVSASSSRLSTSSASWSPLTGLASTRTPGMAVLISLP